MFACIRICIRMYSHVSWCIEGIHVSPDRYTGPCIAGASKYQASVQTRLNEFGDSSGLRVCRLDTTSLQTGPTQRQLCKLDHESANLAEFADCSTESADSTISQTRANTYNFPILPGFDTQLETCVFHLICRNAEELVSLKVGQPWRCDLSESRLHGLRLALMNTTRELRLLSV